MQGTTRIARTTREFAPVARPRHVSRAPVGGIRRGANTGAVLRAMLYHEPISRSTIARLTGLSPAAVSGHCAELTQLGLLREAPNLERPKSQGRPHVPVEIDDSKYVVGAIHVALEHATTAVLDLRGEILAQHQQPHAGAGPTEVLDRAADSVTSLLATYGGERRALGIGVASGGWVDDRAGTLVEHSRLGWNAVPVRDQLNRRTGLPVHVDAHARSLVHAERLFGQTRGHSSVLSLFVGNMVDAAFATGDQVHHGPQSQAGAIAHLPVPGSTAPCACGRVGCLQATVSESSVALRAVRAGIIAEPSIPLLVAAALAGDARALGLFIDRARLVGGAAALLLDVLNPDVVVVVEAGVANLPVCLEVLRDEVRAKSWVTRDPKKTVVSTSFPQTVLATAAGAVLLDLLYRDPLTLFSQQHSHAS